MFEAKVRTEFGELCFSFQNDDDLDATLMQMQQYAERIRDVAKGIAPSPVRTPRPGFEHVYRFSPTGSLELLILPPKINQAVAITLFGYHPDPLSVTEIERMTGVSNVVSRVLGQTLNKDYYCKLGDKYGLTIVGQKMVMDKFGPKASSPNMSDGEDADALVGPSTGGDGSEQAK